MATAEATDRWGTAWRRPAVIALAAALAIAVLVRFELSERGIVGAALVALLVILAAIDLERRIIPNLIVLPATAAILTANIALFPDRWAEWVFAALGAAAFLAIPLLFVREGIGMGDIKLALLLGAGLGEAVIDALIYGSIAGAVFALILVARHGGAAKRMNFAYGPFLSLGGVIAAFTGHHLG
jgi:leader peptidase (prepilin peptidase) / N-methyltransferase